MKYAQIVPFEICNGKNAGTSLFVQGCHFQCVGCFNQSAWDFNGGKEWTKEIENKFFELINRPYIKRVSILGGEPLADEHANDVYNLIKKIRNNFPNKIIWLYTGFKIENILNDPLKKEILKLCDVVVDGRYIDELRDVTLPFCGSKNQRVIDIKKSLKENKIVLYK